MDASILICTHNRPASLSRTLQSLEAMDRPAGCRWEVVVIDNASTEPAAPVVDAWRHRLPVRLAAEPRPGKSHALNSGLDLCRGRVLLLTDDDVVVDRAWLRATLEAFDAATADAVFGRILPLWPHAVPRWYSPRLAPALALLDYGPAPFDLQPGQEGFFGANAAVARQAVLDVGRWSTVLNRVGRGLIMGEDSDLCRRLVHAGRRVRYEPASIVYHDVRAERLSKRYFRRWFMAHGQSAVLRGGEFPRSRLQVAGVPLYLTRMAVGCALRSAGLRLQGRAPEAFAEQMRLWRLLGAIRQFRGRSEDPPCRT